MRISRQSIHRRVSLADLMNKARIPHSNGRVGGRSFHRIAIGAAVILLLIVRRLLQSQHSTSEQLLITQTPPSEPAPLLRSSKKSPETNAFPFFVNIDNSYLPPISKPESIGIADAAFTVFYNLFIPKDTISGSEYATSVLMEQLGQVADSLSKLENGEVRKRAVVYYNLIGKPLRPEKMTDFCHSLHPKLECIMIGYYEKASESVTLQNVHDFCTAVDDEDVRVTYIHSKGSYHHTDVNRNWRRELTNAVLHPHCLNPPNDTCNVCGTSFFTRFAFMFPGNMWTSKCSYIKKLLPPYDGGEYDSRKKESIARFLKMRLYGVLDATLLEDRIDYFGLGRYRLEHWIGSHPSIMPCEMHRENVTLGIMVGGQVNSTYDYHWGMGPRREWVVPEIESAQKHLEEDDKAAFKEYYFLAGNLLKWFTLYGSDGVPDNDSWVWEFFPSGNRWRDLVAQYGKNAIDQVAAKLSNELYSAYSKINMTNANVFVRGNHLSANTKPPVVIFYNIAYPKDRKKEAQYALKIQLDVLANGQYDIQTRSFHHERATVVYYTLAEGDSDNADFIVRYCNRKKQNMTCHLLNEVPSAETRGETLEQLHKYCEANPSSRVTYLSNMHPPIHGTNTTGRHPMQKLRAYAAAATSKMCLRSRDTCNVCGMEFYALPYSHFSGNSFTADCEYVNKLIPPRQFEESMNNLSEDALLTHLERSFTSELFPFTPQNLGIGHYSVEHWIGSHPDIKPCDIAPVKKRWLPWFRGNAYIANDYSSSRIYDFRWGLAPRRSHAPVGALASKTESSVRENDTTLFRDYFYLAGNLYKWTKLYNRLPPENSWVWNWFPGGDVWKAGVSENGSEVVNEFTLKYADPNQGVPF